MEPRAEPKYRGLVERLHRLIDALPIGAAVPSERQLADDEGVSRMTARRALAVLEREGRLVRQVGRGSFVARPAVSLPLQLTSFSDDMRARGLVPSSRVLLAEVATDGEAAAALGIGAAEPVVRLDRLRLADGLPMAIERSRLVADAVPGLLERFDPATESLYRVLDERFGLRFDSGEQTIRAAIVRETDVAALAMQPGEAVIEFVRDSVVAGRTIEHTLSIYPADRFELRAGIVPVRARGSGLPSALRPRG
ncbi:GntR family transcriptional regulator [Agrococcus sp. ARC_14]|uniref:GntR family transcriptional regulator n=1 Tax=Agrococcus sp. ARC_14 TaxID=2919927 RepID=UPI001F05BDC3|nr:GntR family transcriptional regulator [Agrococcus sp. ARC_14]MCH1881646.1 GntR family transcriptional regulator [Agrococcus sp. ARC_14]